MKYLPSVISILVMLASAFALPIQHAVAAHPEAGVIVAGLYAILAHISPQPQR